MNSVAALVMVFVLAFVAGCTTATVTVTESPGEPQVAPTPTPVVLEYVAERTKMVDDQIKERAIRDDRIIAAMMKIPRHLFVPQENRQYAYADAPLPIEFGQAISQPYIVAIMCERVKLKQGDKVLEIGTGSGYGAAVLAELTDKVYTIEILEPLAEIARKRLAGLGYSQVHVRAADGYAGWPEAAPFDAIIITCAVEEPPPELIKQLAVGGRMCVPVGPSNGSQQLVVLTREKDGTLSKEYITPVRFVPMTGEAQKK
jgi:protein-L-isoaspartate(D-aspartate) O-methyltransferase